MRKMHVAMAAALTLVAAGTTRAQEPVGWKFEFTPYVWAAGLEGDVTVGGREAEFDKSFGDLFEAVEAAGSFVAIAQYDRYLMWAQVDMLSMSTDQLDVDDQPRFGSFDSDLLLAEGAVGYQVDGWAEGQTFDILLGVRSTHLDNELALNNGMTLEDDRDLNDVVVVIRPSVPLFASSIDGLRFNPTMAFGAGDSDFVYELQPQIQYDINETMSARFGYRRVGYKFEGDNNENELNVSMAGLIAGLGITF